MKRGVAVVVRCGDQVQQLYATIRSATRQSVPPASLVVVTDPGTPSRALPWISSFVAQSDGRLVRAESAAAGAVRNAGVNAAAGEYAVCVDAGERLDPRYLELAVARFESAADVVLVTSALRRASADGAVSVHSAGGCSLADLAADLSLVHSASVFRRRDWRDLGGFDAGLGALDEVDLWFRLLARGRGELIPLPLVERSGGSRSLERRGWEREARHRAVDLLIDRYPEPFRAAIGAAVERQQRRLQEAQRLYREGTGRRDRALAEIGALAARARELAGIVASGPTAGGPPELLSRTTPVSREWGNERGGPVDRVLIERFLRRHAGDVRGVVLEVQENDYTVRFGGDRVTRSEVLDLDPANPRATLVADLRAAANLADGSFDCILLTQTVHVVDDARAVLAEAYRLLAPGGTLLATLPAASRVCLEYGPDGDSWRVTPAGAAHLLAGIVPAEQLEVDFEGSVVTKAAFLYGLGAPELDATAAAAADPFYPTIVTVRARKPRARADEPLRRPIAGAAPFAPGARRRVDPPRAAILLYHRVGWPPSDLHGVAVAPEEFRAQLAFLKERCRVLPLAELVEAAAADCLPPRAVALTFDDGYADNLEVAAPLLAELGVPATFFVTTEGWEERRTYWWDRLAQALLFAPAPPPRLAFDLGARRIDLATTSLAERRAAYDALHDALKRAPAPDRERALAAVLGWAGAGETSDPADARLAAAEVARLAKRPGVTIGAHTARHLLLPEQTESVQRAEIAESLAAVGSLLGERITSLAYPYGGCSETTVRVARDLGVVCALTTEAAPLGAFADPLRLPRFAIGGRGCRARFEAAISSLDGAAGS